MADAEKINEDIIAEVKTAINNAKNAYDGAFDVKEEENGTDRMSTASFVLTSKNWKRDSRMKISVDRISEYISDPNDPWYWSKIKAGVLLDRYGFIGFVGSKSALKDLKNFEPNKIKDFLENLFIPTSIKILEAYKTKKANKVIMQNLRDLYTDIFEGTMEKVPTEEQISQLFIQDKANNSQAVNESGIPSSHSYPTEYALKKYLETLLTDEKHGDFERNNVFVLSLDPEKSTFNSFKEEVTKVLGKDALKKKSGTFRYFILFKNMEKEDILRKLKDFPNTGDTWDESEIVETDRSGRKYYIVKFEFSDTLNEAANESV